MSVVRQLKYKNWLCLVDLQVYFCIFFSLSICGLEITADKRDFLKSPYDLPLKCKHLQKHI